MGKLVNENGAGGLASGTFFARLLDAWFILLPNNPVAK